MSSDIILETDDIILNADNAIKIERKLESPSILCDQLTVGQILYTVPAQTAQGPGGHVIVVPALQKNLLEVVDDLIEKTTQLKRRIQELERKS